MITRDFLDELHRLDNKDKLKVFQLLAEELSLDVERYNTNSHSFVISPPFRASEETIKLMENLGDRPQSHD